MKKKLHKKAIKSFRDESMKKMKVNRILFIKPKCNSKIGLKKERTKTRVLITNDEENSKCPLRSF
jgi:ribosomal protein L31E